MVGYHAAWQGLEGPAISSRKACTLAKREKSATYMPLAAYLREPCTTTPNNIGWNRLCHNAIAKISSGQSQTVVLANLVPILA
jgi:isochorismate synthase EntC